MDKSITSPDDRAFLRELRAARKRNGLTQIDLAAKLGETQTFVSKCERRERRLDVIESRAFCWSLGTSLTAFAEHLEGVLAAQARTSTKGKRR